MFDSFSHNGSLMEKPGIWLALAKCVKINTYGRVIFKSRCRSVASNFNKFIVSAF